jgi:hypothetical protein
MRNITDHRACAGSSAGELAVVDATIRDIRDEGEQAPAR